MSVSSIGSRTFDNCVRLALRIQDPDTVVGLKSWNAAYLSFVFHDFFRLLPPQRG